MPRSEFIEKVYYTYPELSDEAKEAVRNKYNTFLWDDGEMNDRMTDIADNILEAHGFTKPENLEYDLYGRGGEPKFSTTGELTAGGAEWNVVVTNPPGRYTGMELEIYTYDADDSEDGATYRVELSEMLPQSYAVKTYEDILAQLREIVSEIQAAFIAEDEYMSSDEVVAEASEANGWEYTEDGELI